MYKNVTGLTLLELLTTLIIVGLLGSLALPTLFSFIHEQQLKRAANDLFAAATLARSEAIKSNRPVFLSARQGGWASGWEIYADMNHNGIRDGAERVFLAASAFPELTIQGNQPVATYIRFTPSGRAKLPGGAFQAGTITLCRPDSKARRRSLVLSSTGRLRTQVSTASGCVAIAP